MAEDHQKKSHEYQPTVADEGPVETRDRGLFDFLGKKEEKKPQEEVIVTEFENVKVSEPEPVKVEKQKEEEEKKPCLLEKLHRYGSSSSSSSSDEEGEEGEEKKKKKKEKKGLKEKLKEKISGEKEEEKHEDTTVPVEKCDELPVHPEEKKCFLDKIKDKLPGHHKKAEEVTPPPPPPPPAESATVDAPTHEGEAKEKKGILEKIKEKLPGYHPKTEEKEEKESSR